jgi:hypothetical protein
MTSRLASLEREAWEVVVEPDRYRMPARYHVVTLPENAVYAKTREPDLQALAGNPTTAISQAWSRFR